MPMATRKDSAPSEKLSSRKRARAESETNDDESKKRGRPRLDSQDESAADRRRTQIRVAQRAYRQRKENTIDDLRKQVKDLQDVVQVMGRGFHEISQQCLSQNLSPSVIAGFQNIAQQYSNMVTQINSPNPDDSPMQAHKSELPMLPVGNVMDFDTPSRPRVDQAGRGPASPTDTASPTVRRTSSYAENVPAIGQTSDHAKSSPDSLFFSFGSGSMPETNITKSIAAPSTYSFQERTFARRLHRASCEYAFGLACDPSRLPANFNSVFRLTLRAAGTVDRVKTSLQATLSRGVREPLSNWGVTFIHIGGAGTHYPRPPEEGGFMHHLSNSWAVTTVGPHRLFGSSMEEATTAEMLLRGTPGMQDEFFDAYDVEGYLAEKGIHIHPMSSFADIELPGSDSSSNEATSMRPTTMDPAAYYMQSMSAAPPIPNLGYSTLGCQPMLDMSFTPPSHSATSPQLGQAYDLGVRPYSILPPRKLKVTIDVAEFIKLMSLGGICLMRAPGYRRESIDAALRKAVVQAR